MPLNNKYITLLLSVLVFVLFFGYYFITSNSLPSGAGPDWKSNTDISRFIYEHGRLAVLPDDEESLQFTAYGGTRALRPPLSYIVSASAAKTFAFTNLDSHMLFRKGSALLCALAIALTFYALSIYFGSYAIGIFGSAIMGLMPQLTFIASYNNDDSGAIFSATLMLAVLVRIYRYGISNTNAALIGLAAGMVVISKMSAWLLMPFVILFLILFLRSSPLRSLLRYAIIAGAIFVLAGGWWFAFNIYHYGIDDPIQKKITNTMIEKHRRLAPDSGVGFAAQGIGFYELIIQNHKNFLGETAKATIGNLDWLKLKVGPLQYTVYKAIFLIALFYYFFSLTSYQLKRFRGDFINDEQNKQIVFESLLILIILFQIIMYTWTNIHNDIQIQGKYIIPISLAILILFFSGIKLMSGMLEKISKQKSPTGNSLTTPDGKNLTAITAGILFILYIHWDAWVNYVIPFYKPPAYNIKLGEFHSIPLNTGLHQRVNSLDIQEHNGTIRYTASGKDPKVIFYKDICKKLSTTSMLHLEFTAENADTMQFFIDENEGFSTKVSATAKYRRGDNTIMLPISANQCKQLRFDPFIEDGSILLKRLQIAPLDIRVRRE